MKKRAQSGWVAALLVTPLVVLSGAQPWSRDSRQWTVEDARRLLLDSPWSQSASASFGPERTPEDMPKAPLPGAAEAGIAGPHPYSGAGWDGGPGRDKGGTPTLPITIRWDSALPVRQAVLKLPPSDRAAGDFYTAAQADKDYVISVTGLAPARSYTGAGQLHKESQSSSDEGDSAARVQDLEQLLEGVMGASILVARNQQPIRPEDVKLDAATGTLHLFFPRRAPISSSAKEVTFFTRFGSLRVARKFRLKEMMYQGRLEL